MTDAPKYTQKQVDGAVTLLQKRILELETRLKAVVDECRNRTSGATEDSAHDSMLYEITRLAQGRAVGVSEYA